MSSCRMASVVCVSMAVLLEVSSHAQPPASGARPVLRRAIASSDLADLPHVEPRIAANPRNPQNLVIGAMLFRRDGGGESTCTVLTSRDEGVNWRRSILPTREGLTGGGDPWVAFDGAGVAYLSCLHGATTDSGERTSAVAVYRSEDGGVTWSAPVRLPGRSYDRPVLVVGTGGVGGGSLLHVVVSQGARREFGAANPISVLTSADGGRTFGEPVQVLPNNLNNNVRSAAVLADGSLLAVFFDIGTLTGDGLLNQFRIWTIRSRDQGRTFGPSLFLNENAGGDQVDIAVDARNGLFAVWDVVRGEATGRGVFFARSDDAGHSWSKATRLAPPVSGPKHQHVPTIAVQDDGVLGALWVDYRNDARGECSEVYFRASLDRGATWQADGVVSAGPSCARIPANVIPRPNGRPQDVAGRWREGGDYHGLIPGSPGRFHAAWSDSSTGVFQIHVATLDVRAPG